MFVEMYLFFSREELPFIGDISSSDHSDINEAAAHDAADEKRKKWKTDEEASIAQRYITNILTHHEFVTDKNIADILVSISLLILLHKLTPFI